MNKINKLGFTIAEVLIVLGIIGMIAQMTLPTLMQSTSKQTQITSIKKFYSEFDQGLKMLMQNEGCEDLACTELFNGNFTTTGWYDKIDAAFKNVFKIQVSCGNAVAGCIPDYPTNLKTLAGGTVVSSTMFTTGYIYMTSDGALVSVRSPALSSDFCKQSPNPLISKYTTQCGSVFVDVNGAKSPNQWGRDAFFFLIGGNGIYPAYGVEYAKALGGASYTTDSAHYWNAAGATNPACNTSNVGYGCSARLMENGWVMDY